MINTIYKHYFIFCVLLSSSFLVSAAQEINIFKAGSYAQIQQQRQNKPFLLVFWSLDCPPCYKELAMLAEEIKDQPRLDLVLISTDSVDDIKELQRKLSRFGLSHIKAWVFENEMAQQLRYEIDPSWYGELPRSYLFDTKHNRHATSGILRPAVLQRWSSLLAEIYID